MTQADDLIERRWRIMLCGCSIAGFAGGGALVCLLLRYLA